MRTQSTNLLTIRSDSRVILQASRIAILIAFILQTKLVSIAVEAGVSRAIIAAKTTG